MLHTMLQVTIESAFHGSELIADSKVRLGGPKGVSCLRVACDVPVADVKVLDPTRRQLLHGPHALVLPVGLLQCGSKYAECTGMALSRSAVRTDGHR